ncbi:hypothetical protein TorRG33x02_157150, partial [Trema orientale]
FRYEKLPEFCFGCGHIGHGANECPSEGSLEAAKGKNLPYGGWMQASSFEHNYSLSARIPDTNQRKRTPGAAETCRSIISGSPNIAELKGGYEWPPPPHCRTGHMGKVVGAGCGVASKSTRAGRKWKQAARIGDASLISNGRQSQNVSKKRQSTEQVIEGELKQCK